MRVVHVNTSDNDGGAAIAAHRLHLALLDNGIESKMLVMNKRTDELGVEVAIDGRAEKFIFSALRKLINKVPTLKYKVKDNIIFSPANMGVNISRREIIKNADVIVLHWIVGGYLSLQNIKKIAKLNKKVIWILHDSWAFTGGCHVRYDCKKYRNQCGTCHMLTSKKEKDLSRKIFIKKKKVFSFFKDLTIVTPSKWLGESVKESALLGKFKLEVIPNTLNEKIFKQVEKSIARNVLNLDTNKKYLCFGAMSATSTPYKGWKYLNEALEILNRNNPELKEKVELLVFGASHSNDIEKLPYKTKFLGRVYDEYTLSLIYNSADVFVAPSLEDNLPNTVLESLFCGTPVVGFDVGGLPDMIIHNKNGYLAEYKNIADFADGIFYCLENFSKVKINREYFSTKNIIKKMIEIYRG